MWRLVVSCQGHLAANQIGRTPRTSRKAINNFITAFDYAMGNAADAIARDVTTFQSLCMSENIGGDLHAYDEDWAAFATNGTAAGTVLRSGCMISLVC
jgi:hypothetical protein